MPKSELGGSDFGSLGFNEHEAQIEHSVCTIKTQMIENRTTFKWAFGFQKLKSVRNLNFLVRILDDIRIPNRLELGQK